MTDTTSDSTEGTRPARDPSPADVSAQLARILASPDFAQALRLQKFLTYVVEETLAGRGGLLKEYSIALEVYDRDDSFDPRTNSIVHVEASRLRGKLKQYSGDAGRDDAVRITLPTGSYAPMFAANIARAVTAEAGEVRSIVVDRPIVAVLPFTNMSGDPEQEYFADGLTEDIITVLSQTRMFPVIARNSTFTYKGMAVLAQQVAEELGARYIVEGGVRKGGSQVRITAQLIDSETGHHVWAEKYDRELDDIFAVQDEITQRITSIIVPTLEQAEQKRVATKRTDILDAWDCYLRGKAHLNELTKQGTIDARAMFERAIALDAAYSQAYAEIAHSHYRDVVFGFSDDEAESLGRWMEAARRAVALDDEDAWGHIVLGMAFARNRQFDLAAAQCKRAMELEPAGRGQIFYGVQLIYLHKPDEGIPFIEAGLDLSPKDPYSYFYMTRLADAHLQCRRYEQAIEWAQKAIGRRPDYVEARLVAAASLGLSGEESEAANALKECGPDIAENWDSPWFYLDTDELEHVRGDLRTAGMKG